METLFNKNLNELKRMMKVIVIFILNIIALRYVSNQKLKKSITISAINATMYMLLDSLCPSYHIQT